jgi:hypothetical protein
LRDVVAPLPADRQLGQADDIHVRLEGRSLLERNVDELRDAIAGVGEVQQLLLRDPWDRRRLVETLFEQ